jgi:LPS sulfotransferase NodH
LFTCGGTTSWRRRYRYCGLSRLSVDPVGVTHRILDFLDLELPPGRELAVQHRRLADELNAQWIARYRAELLRY